jgi:HEPN domain-containing protein
MTPLAAEWVAKAEGDYATARRELKARKQPNFDAVCFHAQQCAEKYLKALLQERRLSIPRTHNLEALAKPLLTEHASLKTLATSFRTLGAYAVETRYPGKSADHALAGEALGLCVKIRRACRRALKAQK